MIKEFLPNRKYKFIGDKLPWYIEYIEALKADFISILREGVRCEKIFDSLSSVSITTVSFIEIPFPISIFREELKNFIIVENLIQEEFDIWTFLAMNCILEKIEEQ